MLEGGDSVHVGVSEILTRGPADGDRPSACRYGRFQGAGDSRRGAALFAPMKVVDNSYTRETPASGSSLQPLDFTAMALCVVRILPHNC